jgi:peptide methionine sulfoxide reductase msrA/msrB
MEFNNLTDEESYVIEKKGTERPFTGKYNDFYEDGLFKCRKCNTPLYKSEDKFTSSCGWPSFDDQINGAVKKIPDADGRRVEIVCNNCNGHLGHVFEEEGFTHKNTRHCVNSISLKFESEDKTCKEHAVAYFAAGCFWGVEHHFSKLKGVYSATSGYMGGHTDDPDYNAICTGNTGHLEAVKIDFDECQISFEELSKYFFEIHDFTQTNGQGPDIGSQYLSAIFYVDNAQKETTLKLIDLLEDLNFKVATSLHETSKFYKAEDYHQDYYVKTGKTPYCHTYRKIF